MLRKWLTNYLIQIASSTLDFLFMKKQKEPKIKLSFDGCYNYKKLKEEGLVETPKTEEEFLRMYKEDNSDAP